MIDAGHHQQQIAMVKISSFKFKITVCKMFEVL